MPLTPTTSAPATSPSGRPAVAFAAADGFSDAEAAALPANTADGFGEQLPLADAVTLPTDALFVQDGAPELTQAARAYALRLQGHREVDIPSAMADAGEEAPSPAAVREAIERHARAAQESHSEAVAIALELDRLDVMLAGLWPQAAAGEVSAVDRVLKIGERRDKLLGLHLEASRAAFLNGAAADNLEDLSAEELKLLEKLAERGQVRKPNIGSKRSRGGKPGRPPKPSP
jgi:hypothetical protein